MIDIPTVIDIVATHAGQIECYGGAHGIRDAGLMEAALFRSQTGYYKDTITDATAL